MNLVVITTIQNEAHPIQYHHEAGRMVHTAIPPIANLIMEMTAPIDMTNMIRKDMRVMRLEMYRVIVEAERKAIMDTMREFAVLTMVPPSSKLVLTTFTTESTVSRTFHVGA
jgi:hypothetical protein